LNAPLLELRHVTKHFTRGGARVAALESVDLTVLRSETLGLVGESGCGKSTLARAIMRLIPLDAGEIRFDGVDLTGLSRQSLTPYRARLQMVFQDPHASFNPRLTLGRALEEPLIVQRRGDKAARRESVLRELDRVGLGAEFAGRFPHELSGGQRQRVAIARALILRPDMIICDEATSALDVSVRAQIINLLQDLQGQLGIGSLFISHDLSVVKHIADRVAVMYLGRVVELAPRARLWRHPQHPYTRALLASVPARTPRQARERAKVILQGDPPALAEQPTGCRFHPRCPVAVARCRTDLPRLREGADGHSVACHLA